jgi:hypothetical protein
MFYLHVFNVIYLVMSFFVQLFLILLFSALLLLFVSLSLVLILLHLYKFKSADSYIQNKINKGNIARLVIRPIPRPMYRTCQFIGIFFLIFLKILYFNFN